MITLKDFMEVVNYRVTEGSEYCWTCFGYKAYRLDSWNGEQDGHTISIVFDTETQEVYQIEASDYANNRAYRMTNPDYTEAHTAECKSRDIVDMAWEQDDGTPLMFIELDVDTDFLEKARAIVAGEDYDTRVQIQVTFDDNVLFELMKIAHEQDITFNQLVEQVLTAKLDELTQEKFVLDK